ncbi:MAG: GNAT family N-acetyltransferase [Micrococcus sp.]|nr:GNAT family N-acetyltransferase [Micrococcus sp.]
MLLRDVQSDDLDAFFAHQQDAAATTMSAFAPRNPRDRGVFDYHWARLLNDADTVVRTIEFEGAPVGAVMSVRENGIPELSFWTAQEVWGKGLTTAAVDEFLAEFTERPVRARVPSDNVGSQKVLSRRGFAVIGEDQVFSNARAAVVTELILELGEQAAAGE